MANCDVCGRAVFKRDAVTFERNEAVICRRAGCESAANACKLRYYEDGRDGVMDFITGEAPDAYLRCPRLHHNRDRRAFGG